MDRTELDASLEARITLMDLNRKDAKDEDSIIDTSYAKKALETHSDVDMAKAIIEARKINTPLGKIWLEKLESYYKERFLTDLESVILTINGDYDSYVRRAVSTNNINDIYAALEKLTPVKTSPAYRRFYDKFNDEFEKQTGFRYENKPDDFLELYDYYDKALKLSNVAHTLVAAEHLKNAIETEEREALASIYQSWYNKVNSLLDKEYEISFEKINELRKISREKYIRNELNINIDSINTAIYSLMLKKKEKNKDQEIEFEDLTLSTESCETLDDMYVKYSREIEEEYNKNYEKQTRLMQNVSSQVSVDDLTEEELKEAQVLRVAKYLFSQERGLHNTEDDFNEKENREIVKKNNELNDILINRGDVDFSDPKQVFFWVQKMIPYINIPSVNGNIKTPIDVYLLEVLRVQGYTSEKVAVKDTESFYRNSLALQLKELEEYGFFVSEYYDNAKESQRLTSDKAKDVARLNYHKELYHELDRRLTHINNKLSSINELTVSTSVEYAEKKEKLEADLKKINDKIASISDLTVTSNIYRTEETEAYDAYQKAMNEPNYDNFRSMFTLIQRLHERDYKDKILIAAYQLLDKYKEEEKLSKKDVKTIESDNKLVGIRRKDMSDLLEEKNDIEEDLLEYADRKQQAFDEINEVEKKLLIEKAKYERKIEKVKDTLTRVAERLKEQGYVDTSKEFKDIDTGVEEDKLFDKIKNLFTKKKKQDDTSVIVPIPEDEETLIEFQPIKKIKKIKKPLYEKISADKLKKKISQGLKQIKEHIVKNAKAYAAAAFIMGGVSILGGIALNANKADDDIEAVKLNPIPIEHDNDAELAVNLAEDKDVQDALENAGATLEEAQVSDIEIPFTENTQELSISEIAQRAVDGALTGERTVYRRVSDAEQEVNGVNTENLYEKSWENANAAAYYDENSKQITPEEAARKDAAGEDVYVRADNKGVGIGFVRLR